MYVLWCVFGVLQHRRYMVDWVSEVGEELHLQPVTIHSAISFLDQVNMSINNYSVCLLMTHIYCGDAATAFVCIVIVFCCCSSRKGGGGRCYIALLISPLKCLQAKARTGLQPLDTTCCC
jgi:hypothetical protein